MTALSPLVAHWEARFLTGEPLSETETEWLFLGAEMYGVEALDGESALELWPRLRDAMGSPLGKKHTRKKPAPHPWERDAIEQARGRNLARPIPPSARVLPPKTADAPARIASRHGDDKGWYHQIGDAIGSRSAALVAVFIDELCALAGESCGQQPDEDRLNAALAIIHAVKPRSTLEAMLAAQMVAVHWLTMKNAATTLQRSYDPLGIAAVSKLARTFTEQVDAMQALKGRRPSRQTIKVQRDVHVHHHDHRHLHASPVEGGQHIREPSHEHSQAGSGNLRSVEGKSLAHDAVAPLPSPHAAGIVVPLSRDKGKEALPKAWRGKGVRRTEGGA